MIYIFNFTSLRSARWWKWDQSLPWLLINPVSSFRSDMVCVMKFLAIGKYALKIFIPSCWVDLLIIFYSLSFKCILLDVITTTQPHFYFICLEYLFPLLQTGSYFLTTGPLLSQLVETATQGRLPLTPRSHSTQLPLTHIAAPCAHSNLLSKGLKPGGRGLKVMALCPHSLPVIAPHMVALVFGSEIPMPFRLVATLGMFCIDLCQVPDNQRWWCPGKLSSSRLWFIPCIQLIWFPVPHSFAHPYGHSEWLFA
jgi:hypothetical protein